MKKIRYLLIGLPLLLVSLNGCANQKKILTYGTYIPQTIFSLKELSNAELVNKANNKETFLLAVYQGQYSENCNCWVTFENVIANYMNKYHEQVYVFDSQAQDETVSKFKIAKVDQSTPYLYIFEADRQVACFNFSDKKDKTMFEEINGDAMYKGVHKKINSPKMYFANDAYIKENVLTKDEAVLLFIRNSCEDCKYVLPNVLVPYINNKEVKKDIYVFDLDPLLKKDAVTSNSEEWQYQKTKDYYNLSNAKGNPLGYNNGFVPTIQYYEEGILKDAAVYFNDVVEKNENDEYYISDSFYTQERLTSLHYLTNVKTPTVLKGLKLSDDQVVKTDKGYVFMAQEKAAEYHDPLFKAFLDRYLL